MDGVSVVGAMAGGAVAGFAEHLVMFPVDTLKTRLQVVGQPGMPLYRSMPHAFNTIVAQEGFARLYRGIPAVLAAAIPSHAAYFGTLEIAKHGLGANESGNFPLRNALAGALATISHDVVVTPLDVVKQRLQVHGNTYSGTVSCLKSILEREGWKALYRSYPTTLLMNVPFMSLFVSTYETAKFVLETHQLASGTGQHVVAAGFAGSLSGLLTNPLDVVKTRIQVLGSSYGMIQASFYVFGDVFRSSGFWGFFKGAGARSLYFAPSAAITWSTYEMAKTFFGLDFGDVAHEVPI